jgi:hypothetical protein
MRDASCAPASNNRPYCWRVTDEVPEKSAWVRRLRRHGSDADDLAALVEQDGDPFETSLYEDAADPSSVTNERDQRRYRAMYRRRLRHLGGRERDRE